MSTQQELLKSAWAAKEYVDKIEKELTTANNRVSELSAEIVEWRKVCDESKTDRDKWDVLSQQLKSNIAEVTKQRDEALNKVADVKAAHKFDISMAKSAWSDHEKQFADQQTQIETLSRQAASMREALEQSRDALMWQMDHSEPTGIAGAAIKNVKEALSSDAGKGFVRREVLEKAFHALELIESFGDFDHYHQEGCPNDDTCECPIAMELNEAITAVQQALKQ